MRKKDDKAFRKKGKSSDSSSSSSSSSTSGPPEDEIQRIRQEAMANSDRLSGHGRQEHGNRTEIPDEQREADQQRSRQQAADIAEQQYRARWKREHEKEGKKDQ